MIGKKHSVIEWLSWLPNKSSFDNSNILETFFHKFVIRQPDLFQMIVSDEFLKQREAEAFLKFNCCFSTEFAR